VQRLLVAIGRYQVVRIAGQLIDVNGFPLFARESREDGRALDLKHKDNAVGTVCVTLNVIHDDVSRALGLVLRVLADLRLDDQNFLARVFPAKRQERRNSFRELFLRVDLVQVQHLDVTDRLLQALADVSLSTLGEQF